MKRANRSTTPQGTTTSSLLLTQARTFASHAFQSHVTCVLRHVTVTCLRRLLSQRVRHHLRHNIPQDQLSNDALSIGEIFMRPKHGGASSNPLSITEEDVQYCYSLATRLGKKWAQALQRKGYVELAELTLTIVAYGQFLEPQSSCTKTTVVENNVDSQTRARRRSTSDFVSPYTALHALRRYPDDCNGSGLPLQRLSSIDTDDDDDDNAESMVPKSSISSARKVIRQIDTMVNENGMSYWRYGWDAIEEAAKRNRQRIDYSRIGNASATTTSLIATKAVTAKGSNEDDEAALLQPDDAVEEGGDGLINSLDEGDDSRRNSNQVADSLRVAEHSRKRGRSALSSTANSANNEDFVEEVDIDNMNDDILNAATTTTTTTTQFKRGRPPSSIDVKVYHRNDILNELTLQERKQLIESSIHPPLPYESDMVDSMNDSDAGETSLEKHATSPANYHAVICGALKDFGQIHLWEQTRHASRPIRPRDGNESTMTNKEENRMTSSNQSSSMMGQSRDGDRKGIIYGASEAQSLFQSKQRKLLQKRASARAVKERLGRRTISSAEYRAEYTPHATCSKVRWTEEERMNERNEERTTRRWEQSSGLHKWLEMDMGECMVEVVDDGEQTSLESVENTVNEKKKKIFLGFRSLEMAVKM